MEPTPVRPEPRLVGRDAARRHLGEVLDRIGTDPEHLVIVGEAGIGKTTLWNHALATARRRGFRTLASRPGEDDWGRPNTLLRDLAADLPELAAALAGHLDQPGLATTLLESVRRLSEETPVVLAVDDLPWLDEASARHLRFVLRRVTDRPVVLLATARTWDPVGGSDARPRPLPEVRELALGPLTVRELRGVLSAEVESMTRTEVEHLREASGGNPLFALELARATGSRRPTTVQAAVQSRLEEAPARVRRVLEIIAVGGPSDLARLAMVAGEPVEAAVGDAVARHLAIVDDDFTVRCTHPVVASVVAAALDPLTRRDLHQRWLGHTIDPLQRAVHLARSTMAPDAAVAEDLDRAGERAAQLGSAQLAAELAGHAVRLTAEDDPRLDGRVFRHLGRLAACGQAGRARELADQRIRALAGGTARVELITLRVLLDFVGAEAYLRAALEEDGLDPGLRQLLLELLGWQLGLFKGRLREGIEICSDALAEAVRLGDRTAAGRSAAILAATSMMAGVPRRDLARRAVERAGGVDAGGAGALGIWPPVLQARQFLWDGRLGDARRELERMQRQARDLGSEFQRPYRLRDLAMLELWSGDPDRAEELVTEGLDSARDAGNRQVEAWLALPSGQLAALRGDAAGVDWAARVLADWAELAGEPPRRAMSDLVQGVLAASRAEWGTARAFLTSAMTRLDDLGFRHPGVLRIAADAVVVAGTSADRVWAESLASGLAGDAGLLDSPWVSAWAAAAEGVVWLLDGDARAVERLDSAVDDLRGLGCRLDAVHLSWLLGAARLRAGQRGRARQELAAAQAQAIAWRFDGWAEQVGLVLGRLEADGTLLTPTEERVVDLVRSGRRNREIAAELFVTESTVEAHLTRIYRKLQVRSRAELLAALG